MAHVEPYYVKHFAKLAHFRRITAIFSINLTNGIFI